MEIKEFEKQLYASIPLAAQERHAALRALHTTVLESYLAALAAITPERAAQIVSETDPRSISQLVGHIAAWEQFAILFTRPNLLSAEKLEATDQDYRRAENGEMIPGLRMGWSLWLIFLSHPISEHAQALGMRA